MKPLALAIPLLFLGSAEVLKDGYRAVTLEPGGRARFRVPNLETVTGSSGRCIEEGMDQEEPETFFLEASCGGVRTSLAWKKDGTRVHVMACAEPEERTPAQVKLRKQVQAQLKAWKSVTACVKNGRVELWGWVLTPADKKKVAELEAKFGMEKVRSFVELVEAEDDAAPRY
jgi:hypothetical protein